MHKRLRLLLACLLVIAPAIAWPEPDPYLWLEEIESDRALDWVRTQNQESTRLLEAVPGFQASYERLKAIYDSEDRIPSVTRMGPWLYNFWQDARHSRGIWRRTSPEQYARAEPEWETVLDLDALAREENENWVWKGHTCLHPQYRRCLLKLSRGGADAHVLREFDLKERQFLPDGFHLTEAKHSVEWVDADTLLIATDTGPGSLSDSGYPRIVREWRRGQSIQESRPIYTAPASDVGVDMAIYPSSEGPRQMLRRFVTFYRYEYFLRSGEHLARLAVPEDAEADLLGDQLLLHLKSDWNVLGQTYPSGSLISLPLVAFIEGDRDFEILFEPTAGTTLDRFSTTRNGVLLNLLDQVRGRVVALQRRDAGWHRIRLPVPEFGEARAYPLNPQQSDDFHVVVESFVEPSQLLQGRLGSAQLTSLKQLPPQFDSTGLAIRQHHATSKDGTRVPYFMVADRNLKRDGSNPTLLYGYGGFEISLTPGYQPAVGAAWLERGGVYVVANIRGGGEFGPSWHRAALKQDRQNAYDDFAAVAEHLISEGITSPARLGIQGGSNGGLLVGVQLTQRPELYGAVVCQVPLLDMRRFHLLLAGASWMGEYGNPEDPEQWKWLSAYSPYQNAGAEPDYPPALIMTSTRDDRVHPGHARKMAARLMALDQPVYYYENIEGGHGGAANNQQKAYMRALSYAFLWSVLNREP